MCRGFFVRFLMRRGKMGSAIVFGIGSPHGDDIVGWRAIERLEASLHTADVAFECLDRPGIRLLSRFEGVAAVVLIDAVAGLAPGEVRRLGLDEAVALEQPWTSHGFGLGQTLAMGRVLGALPPWIEIVGIGVGDVPDLERLRPQVAAAVPRAADEVQRIMLRSRHPTL